MSLLAIDNRSNSEFVTDKMKRAVNDYEDGDYSQSPTDDPVVKKPMFEAAKPSRVLHIRGVPNDCTEGEVIHLGLPFGRMTNLVIARKKNQALLEMADLSAAETMVKYYSERPPQIRSNIVHFQFSRHEQLKTENNSALNAGAQAALQVADKLIGNQEENRTVLRIIIDSMLYPITVEVLKTIFSKVGQVLRIVTYTKNDTFQAFIELSDAIAAKTAIETLNGQNIYNGCCTLRIEYSKLQALTVKYNNERMWDFTNPNLPSGHPQQMQQQLSNENTGEGLLGSFESSGFGALSALSGIGKLGGLSGLAGLGGMGNIGALGGMGIGNMGGMGGMTIGNMGSMGRMGSENMAAMNRMGNMGLGMGARGLDGMGGTMGQRDHGQQKNSVLIVSNLDEEKANPDVVFALFGVYGTVLRVKIMYNKKDTALVQFADNFQASNAIVALDKVRWCGKSLKVSLSKHSHIQMPKEGQSEGWLTKDFSGSPAQRFRNQGAKNLANINPPSATLHVSNLSPTTTEDLLTDLFSQYGTVVGFRFLKNERKMALIQMGTVEQGIEALVNLHNREVDGKYNIRVSFTKSSV